MAIDEFLRSEDEEQAVAITAAGTTTLQTGSPLADHVVKMTGTRVPSVAVLKVDTIVATATYTLQVVGGSSFDEIEVSVPVDAVGTWHVPFLPGQGGYGHTEAKVQIVATGATSSMTGTLFISLD